jgi:hypothetical protein
MCEWVVIVAVIETDWRIAEGTTKRIATSFLLDPGNG